MSGIGNAVKNWTQALLTRVGERLKPCHIHSLNAVLNYLEVGRWLKAHGFGAAPRYSKREDLQSAIGAMVASKCVLYIEFGVFRGASLRQWATLLSNPASSLHGFDSFEGLPEDWDAMRRKGEFNLDGQMPQFNDKRVVLHKGWFNQTLPGFDLPTHDRLVIHADADLYSSTDYLLKTLESRIVPGTILMFDEFCDRFHEMLAFEQYLERTGHKYRFLGGTRNLEQCVFQRTD